MGEIPGVSFKGKVDEILLSFGRMADGGGGEGGSFLVQLTFFASNIWVKHVALFFLGGEDEGILVSYVSNVRELLFVSS